MMFGFTDQLIEDAFKRGFISGVFWPITIPFLILDHFFNIF